MARGWLRIYLGAAPGVGKTYAMLNEGWRRAERGTEVLVGYIEDHGRPQTMAQLRDLEVVPRRVVEYRGQTLEEMDLPALVARHPEVVLVDEFAHTNAPGVEHAKRWEDVETLLDAGINVITTLNLQHLESVNDVVETITGVAQRETVPDAMVRRAEQIELVDMTPEALRRRLAHGNVYPADRIDAALTNFFRPGNLAALRELALLWLADRVDDELTSYRERHGIHGAWETRERVVVSVTGVPGGDRLIRRAARMAARSKAELVGVTVRPDDGLRGTTGPELAKHVALVVELGGRHIEVVGGDVAVALVGAARAENATQLVIGASQRSRWAELTTGSVVSRCVREAAGTLDVHVIGSEEGEVPVHPRRSSRRSRRRQLSPLPLRRVVASLSLGALAFVAVTTLLLGAPTPVTLAVALSSYLLVVIAVAAVGGLLPGLSGAVVAFLILNWEFTPPVHTLRIASAQDVLTLVIFLVTGLSVSVLVDFATRRTAEAARARRDARALASMASHITAGDNAVGEMVADIVRLFDLNGAVLRRVDKRPSPESVTVGILEGPSSELVLDGIHTLEIYGRVLETEQAELLRDVAIQLVTALERRRLQAEAADRQSLKQADELRAGLLAAVSHDLRTPLASIKAAATALLSTSATFTSEQVTELLSAIDTEADRLDGLVEDLLDLRRVEEGSVELALGTTDLGEVVDRAVADVTAGHGVDPGVVTRSGLGAVEVTTDAVLVGRIVANLIANAVSHGGGAVTVDLGALPAEATIRVIDCGPGIPVADREIVLRPFQRQGDAEASGGVGLGLAISKGFAEMLGGRLDIEDTPGGGCTMVLSLPRADAVLSEA